MEENIKTLEKFTKIVKGKDYNTKNGWHGYYDDELRVLGKTIENLIKGYKLEKLKNVLDEQSLKEALEDYIPKSKIKEKLEELKNKPVCLCTRSNGKNDVALQNFINNTVMKVLQELLESEE